MWVDDARAAAGAWQGLGRAPVLVERGLALAAEFSVLVARRPGGECVVYPPAFNVHDEGILAWSVIPAPLSHDVLERGRAIAKRIATALDCVGLLVIEMFVLDDGSVLVNELAPRPHNSYHASENACATSQFEQHVRAVCDLPLGSPALVQPAAIANLLGDLWITETQPDVAGALAMEGVRLVLYGKRGARVGRKMGHLVATGRDPRDALARAQDAYDRFAPRGAKKARR
jgi:5-(carboxyamino)imidazole ribonucleotide synthase